MTHTIIRNFTASCIMGVLLCQEVDYGVTLCHSPVAQSGYGMKGKARDTWEGLYGIEGQAGDTEGISSGW